ncbi:ATP-dependent helicase HrpB [Prosthecodimorpha staleyi]|uniref:ATP-dependent helicase HrpB n=1 Tax=Prosthecodimorpha staleyi TaxID=2840188 RepID=A0A947GEC4_9HYPH|nr:ATP-dependent helicase HrpB [Prosthecodimorpha staleyi]MBT9291246.1 ATP-dependent helicase HrpB [Prosthecodimorpha staleyi]
MLPIDVVLPDLLARLEAATRVVLVAPPGAGKTTGVPPALLAAGWRGDGRILMLEPRRLAARAAAARMAAVLGEEVGGTVGFRVRMEAKVSARTRIEVVTEGVFTRLILDDPELTGVAAVLFDEFHERSLDGDLGLALALDAQGALRPDLRLLVMSATLDGARVATVLGDPMLGDAPVVTSEGRAFPVETRHLGRDPGERIEAAMASAVRRALAEETGSVLAFLPGQAEIRRTAEQLDGKLGADVDLAPLYGALTPREQDAAIRPAAPGRRKVVLATAIAETSLTIEGVRIVVDSGLARVPRYEPSTGMTRLETVRVSRASADQRRGRAGRTGPGFCYRLWDEPQTAALAAYDRPEILEADLASFVLDLAAWGVADPAGLAFLDPPPKPAWDEAVALLKDLDALDGDGRLTADGRALQRLPLHPRLGHMVMRAADLGAARLAAEIAAVLSEHGLGGTAVDLEDRIRRLRQDRSQRAEDARRLAQRWARLAGADRDGPASTATPVSAASNDPADAGRLLALAYPDRVAQARGAPGGFRLMNGRGAMLEPHEALARQPWLAVAEVQGTAARARILLAAPLSIEAIEQDFAGHIREEIDVRFDAAAGAVRARRVRRLGALVLGETPVADPDPALVARALVGGLRQRGIGALPWSKAQRQTIARVGFARRADPEGWPDLGDEALAATLETWLAPHIEGRRSLGEIGAADLGNALDALIGWDGRRALDRLAPMHFTAPTGSTVALDYEAENGPVLSIRVQELYGLAQHPSVADGRVPLTVELLSPAHRPIQVTRDLPGFWRGSWREVKSEMKGRYPRHLWPDDPASAVPTTRAKPRGT